MKFFGASSKQAPRPEGPFSSVRGLVRLAALAPVVFGLLGCADADTPKARSVDIPAPATAEKRPQAINERPDSVMYLPLGQDVLIPTTMSEDPLPTDVIGPFELRSETLAGALQLILADYDVPLAFETEEGLTRRITVANLKGPLNRVVRRVCGLADLYCAFEDGLLVVKETQTFTVSIPPVGGDGGFISALGQGLQAITGESPIIDEGTRTIVYTATHRTAELAERYFQRMRKNTALVVFEIYIWEVALNAGNLTGIDWSQIDTFGKFNLGLNLPGGVTGAEVTPISIGLPTTQTVDFANNVLDFISTYGTVKTISQPQITMLSGSEASLRVADTENYVSSLERTVDDGEETVSTQTDTVDTGFTLTIESAWDNATVYGNIEIELQEFQGFQPFEAGDTQLKLPRTTERELITQVRIRPGDSLLIAGLIRENDEMTKSGPGFMNAIFPTSRSASISNTELVFLLRPRVIAYTDEVQEGGFFPRADAFDYTPPMDMNPDLTYGIVKPDYRVMNHEPAVPDYQPRRPYVSSPVTEDRYERRDGYTKDAPVSSIPTSLLDPGAN